MTVLNNSTGLVAKWTGSITEAIFGQTRGVMDEFMAELRDRIRANVSGVILNARTGALASSVQVVGSSQTSRGVTYASVVAGGADAWYGKVHEDGGRDWYPIYAKNARVLAFEKGGKLVFATMVTHPPTLRRPWFKPAVDEMRPVLKQRMSDAIAAAIRGKGNT